MLASIMWRCNSSDELCLMFAAVMWLCNSSDELFSMLAPVMWLCNSSDELFLILVTDSKASIFVRKTLQVLHCEIKKL